MHYKELDRAWAELLAPGAPFEIETIQLRGSPVKAFKNAPPSVREVWLASAAFAERDYLVYGDERYTYADAHRITASVANWLHSKGVKAEDRVAIAMRNFPEWLLIYWGCLSIGVTVVGMNAWWTAPEMAYGLTDAAPKVLFADAERLARMAEQPGMAGEAIVVAVRADPPQGAVAWSEVENFGGAMPDVTVDPDSDACIFYTSGTTGFPKGAQLTHRGCVSNLMNMMFTAQSTALVNQWVTGIVPDPTVPPPIGATLITTPLFHVTANNCGAYAATAGGGKMVLMHKWDATEALKLIEREKITSASGVPVMAREIVNHPDFHKYDTSSLLSLAGGGAQVPPDLVDKIDKSVATARPGTGYGMTETCGVITSIGGDFFVDKPASCGRALPNFEAKAVDDAGNEVPQGQVGELWVRGSSVIKGYINRPEATAESITDGWLHTGDIARFDEEGFIFIVDRKKEMVLRGGENVYCAEVEGAILAHPLVKDATVIGVPHPEYGEEVGCVIQVELANHAPETIDAVIAAISGDLAKFKVPSAVKLTLDDLPRTATGKVLKRDVRTLYFPDAKG